MRSHVLLNFDELDQGLSVLDEQHQKMIVGLVLAGRAYRKRNTSKHLSILSHISAPTFGTNFDFQTRTRFLNLQLSCSSGHRTVCLIL
jgi:hypothetical protein